MNPRKQALLLLALSTAVVPACKKGGTESANTAGTSTAAPELKISEVQLGRHLSADKRVADATDKFSPRDTIYAVALTQGSAASATVTARWTYQDGGQVVKEDSRTIAPNGAEATEFHISKPSGWPKGKYQVTLTMNGSTESKDFEVK
jgi:hypothetical protein